MVLVGSIGARWLSAGRQNFYFLLISPTAPVYLPSPQWRTCKCICRADIKPFCPGSIPVTLNTLRRNRSQSQHCQVAVWGKTLILRTNCLVKSKSRASSLITFLHLAAGVTLNNSPPNVSSALLTQKTHPFWLTHYRILIAFLPGHYTFLSNQSNQFFCAPSSSTCPQFITHCFQRKRWKWLNAFKRRCWKR